VLCAVVTEPQRPRALLLYKRLRNDGAAALNQATDARPGFGAGYGAGKGTGAAAGNGAAYAGSLSAIGIAGIGGKRVTFINATPAREGFGIRINDDTTHEHCFAFLAEIGNSAALQREFFYLLLFHNSGGFCSQKPSKSLC
jgi:hypothetical protein